MLYLVLGLVLFLGVHSLHIVVEDWRNRARARLGVLVFRTLYSVVALVGLGLIVWGFGIARETPTMLWLPPRGMRHAAALFTLMAFVLLAAAYVPRNAIRARLHHPMVLAVKSWALGHLLANGSVAHAVLFGAFLAWGVANFIVARRRDRARGMTYVPGTTAATLATLVVGTLAWAVFAFWLHGLLIGIRPMG